MGFYDAVKDDVENQEETHRHTRQDTDTPQRDQDKEDTADTVRNRVIEETSAEETSAAKTDDEPEAAGTGARKTEKDLNNPVQDTDEADDMGNMDELIKQARENEPPDPNENQTPANEEQDPDQQEPAQQKQETSPQQNQAPQTTAQQGPQNPAPQKQQGNTQHQSQDQSPAAEHTTQSSQTPQPERSSQEPQQQTNAETRREQASDIDEDEIPGWMENQMQQDEEQAQTAAAETSAEPGSQTKKSLNGDAPGRETVIHDIRRQNQEIIQHLKGIRTALEDLT